MVAKLKWDSSTKERAAEICGVAVCGFDATVTSTGQQDIPPPREGLGAFGCVGILPPEWWGQFSMPAIRSGWPCSAEALWVESDRGEAEFASWRSVQPMRHASTANHKDITVAIPALKVWIGERITHRLYRAIVKNNRFWRAARISAPPG